MRPIATLTAAFAVLVGVCLTAGPDDYSELVDAQPVDSEVVLLSDSEERERRTRLEQRNSQTSLLRDQLVLDVKLADSGDIRFLGNLFYIRHAYGDTYFVMGECKNYGAGTQAFVRVNIELLDQYGNVIATDFTYVNGTCMTLVSIDSETGTCMTPGEVAFFGTYISGVNRGITGGRFGFEYDHTNLQTPDARVTMNGNIRAVESYSGYTKLSGTLRNNGASDARFCQISCAAKDSSGRLLDVDFTYVDGSSVGGTDTGLRRGESGTFLMYTFAQFSSYRSSSYKTEWDDYGTISCTYSISPSSGSFSAGGGAGTIQVNAGTSCSWVASESSSWVRLTTGGSGTGNGTVHYSVDANSSQGSRSTTIQVATETHTVIQSGAAPCNFTLTPDRREVAPGEGTYTFMVATGTDCQWTAEAHAAWLRVLSWPNNTGPREVQYQVDANQETHLRSAIITVDGAQHTVLQAAGSGGDCGPSSTRLCLNRNRFAVRVSWQDHQGNTGSGITVPQTDDTGCFWFFDDQNLELMVKVLDARGINGYFWVFYGSLTNVQYRITVTDVVTGAVKTYDNPLGNFGSACDTQAFLP